jgi:hypothetical protein
MEIRETSASSLAALDAKINGAMSLKLYSGKNFQLIAMYITKLSLSLKREDTAFIHISTLLLLFGLKVCLF